MTVPTYAIVFHGGCWRIRYEDLYLGQYETPAAAAEAALKVAQSRLEPSLKTQVITNLNGEIVVGDPEESA
jgi:hypothetical protein